MFALQWLSSERAAMEDPAKAHYFLRYPHPTPAPTAINNIYYTQAHEGNQYVWNYSEPEARQYKMDVVVMGPNGDMPSCPTLACILVSILTAFRACAVERVLFSTPVLITVLASYFVIGALEWCRQWL